jgi:hypothetical protein
MEAGASLEPVQASKVAVGHRDREPGRTVMTGALSVNPLPDPGQDWVEQCCILDNNSANAVMQRPRGLEGAAIPFCSRARRVSCVGPQNAKGTAIEIAAPPIEPRCEEI